MREDVVPVVPYIGVGYRWGVGRFHARQFRCTDVSVCGHLDPRQFRYTNVSVYGRFGGARLVAWPSFLLADITASSYL